MIEETKSATYGDLARLFLRVGTQAFGGWPTTALLLKKMLVEKESYVTKQHLQGAVTYAQLIPGATQVAIVSNVGYKLKGLRGAILATVCYLLPALSLIVLFAAIYFSYLQGAHIASHMTGLSAALGGVILANAYRIGKGHATHVVLWLAVITAFVLRFWLGVNSALIIVGFGAVGIVFSIAHAKRATK